MTCKAEKIPALDLSRLQQPILWLNTRIKEMSKGHDVGSQEKFARTNEKFIDRSASELSLTNYQRTQVENRKKHKAENAQTRLSCIALKYNTLQ